MDLVFFLPVSLCYLPLSWGRRSQGTYSCAAGSPLGLPLIPGASGRGLGRSNLALDPELRAETAGTCSAPARLRTFWELWLRPPSFSVLNRINSLCSLCPHTPNPCLPPSGLHGPSRRERGQICYLGTKLHGGTDNRGLHCLWAEGRMVGPPGFLQASRKVFSAIKAEFLVSESV